MSLTAGTISTVSVGSDTASLVTTAASGGTGPYTQQWYRDVTTGFSPAGGNLIAGATALTLNDTGLTPGTTYFYKVVFTDTGASNVTVTATQKTLTTTAPQLSQNQFQMREYLGSLDLRYNTNVVAVEIDVSQATTLYPGAAVKMVADAANLGGVPKVVGCSANSDEVLGFIVYNIKNSSFVAGQAAEIAMYSCVQYLYSTTAITRGARVTLDLNTNGGVSAAVSTAKYVGWAFDGATAAGQLIRIWLLTPSFAVA